jgi:demethylmenaquinone methyltransferase/2-methoxy-6-polyprenyl-1,4-benzoquinol methylase
MRRDLREWQRIISDIEKTGEHYDKVNNVISLGYGDRLRNEILEDVKMRSNVLDAGAGPGSLLSRILEYNERVYAIGLDASYDLLLMALNRLDNHRDRYDLVVGIFENPPFREGIFDAVYSAYAIRDSLAIDEAISKLGRLLRRNGVLIDVDIGKPDNKVKRVLLKIYMITIVPMLASFIYGRINNPWWGLASTLNKLPTNRRIVELFKKTFKRVEAKFYALSTLYIIKGYKKN